HPRIHGVMNAAVELADRSVANMDEACFRRVLRAKVGVSCELLRTLSGEELDFIVMFSSMHSFGRPPGQSNYCAGSTFVDSFCVQMNRSLACPVYVMNWGYWGEVGVAASGVIRANMARAGIGSIDGKRGIAALDRLLSGETRQMAFVVVLKPDALD